MLYYLATEKRTIWGAEISQWWFLPDASRIQACHQDASAFEQQLCQSSQWREGALTRVPADCLLPGTSALQFLLKNLQRAIEIQLLDKGGERWMI